MKPDFADNDFKMFLDEISKCEYYFEFGCGGSTYHSALKNNIKKMYCVESSEKWIDLVKNNINKKNKNVIKKIEFIYVDIMASPNYGWPHKDCPKERFLNYSQALNNIEIPNKSVILIDGRFRPACLLNLFNNIKEDTVILFDDFLNRQKFYGCILDNFSIIKKGTRMVKLEKINNTLDSNLILKTQYNPK